MLCWRLVHSLSIKALLQLLSSISHRSQFSEFRRRRLCGESEVYLFLRLFLQALYFYFYFIILFYLFYLFCKLSIFVFRYFHTLCSPSTNSVFSNCRRAVELRRNQSRQLFVTRTALNGAAVETHFDYTTICSSISRTRRLRLCAYISQFESVRFKFHTEEFRQKVGLRTV